MIIDTHVHIVAPDQQRYPRKLAPDSGWVLDMSGDTMLGLMNQAGIDRAMLVQAYTAYEYDNDYVADIGRAAGSLRERMHRRPDAARCARPIELLGRTARRARAQAVPGG
jgi:predicted TIM-barrel fold metal-dependent hydrolase